MKIIRTLFGKSKKKKKLKYLGKNNMFQCFKVNMLFHKGNKEIKDQQLSTTIPHAFPCLRIAARPLPELHQRAVKPCSDMGHTDPKQTVTSPPAPSSPVPARSHRRAVRDESHGSACSNWEYLNKGRKPCEGVCLVPRLLTLIPGCRRTVHTAGQVGSAGIHPGLTRRRLSQSSNSTGARAWELAWEVHREGSQSAVGVLGQVGAAPARLLLDEGVVGGQRAVWGARMELRPLAAAAQRHSAAGTGSWDGRQWGGSWSQEGQVSDVRAHGHGGARLGQHRWRQVHTLRGAGEGIPEGDSQESGRGSDEAERFQRSVVVKQWRSHLFQQCLKWVGRLWGQKFLPPCLYNIWPSLLSWWLSSAQLVGQGEEQGEDDSPALAWPDKLGVDSD